LDFKPKELPVRFFIAACLFGLVIGVVGWVTNNWSSNFFHSNQLAIDGSNEFFPSTAAIELKIVQPLINEHEQLAGEMTNWK
jgi:hypothetical protein